MILAISRFVAVSVAVFAGHAMSAECDNPTTLNFLLIPQSNADKGVSAMQPLLAELEKETGKKVKTNIPPSYGAVVESLLAESTDIAMLGPASFASAMSNGAAIQVFASYSAKAGPFQDEGPYYHSLLVVRNRSQFTSIEKLKGSTLSLVDPLSTSGSVIPRHLFSPMIGGSLEKYFGRIVYTGGHDKSAAAVLDGRADAAFVSTLLLSEFIREGKGIENDYRILWKSEPIPLDPFVYRTRLCAPIKEKIRKVFLTATENSHKATLQWLNASRIVAFSGENYRTISQIMQSLPK
ncbi:phosphate/phosphite/phosphonate ABC transporter substrate-binding protein [Propionivibrio dicarboxylicus]|uniref:Phosphonate transport system substrate-binding protein n=1 Tax=Propionivibrio dicarboxylicus TaxID=83767 RepID=A0A1G8EQ84_9RHOO|nr:phosphate/phosphite/phosphonate ABC transporter substrate-binding protein [Propionivibrio dicarboxylicus]SDH72028.1 phosphonate transport system substrate-binding protein [Propionivibrio dicarboxylicus]